MSKATSTRTRRQGAEWRAAGWLARHPATLGVPTAATTGIVELGATTVGGMTAGAAAGLLGWYRAHPASFDPIAGSWLRAQRRRWVNYVGRRWNDTMRACDLAKQRRNGEELIPRIVRVRSAAPSIDTLYVRLPRGLAARQFEDRADELADALRVERVAVSRHKPGVVALVVERSNPFSEEPLPAPEIPGEAADVDLSSLEIGETETGDPYRVSALVPSLTVGRMGAGKGSEMWGQLRAMGPLIRDGLVRVRMIDLKGGMETELGKPLFHRHATDMDEAVDVLDETVEDMQATQEWLRHTGQRKFTLSPETPLDLVMVDELLMLTALGEAAKVRHCLREVGKLMTQGRAPGYVFHGYVQEPTKDLLPVRDLFHRRTCLAVNAESHVDMGLGEGARKRGALADRIPDEDAYAGTGYVLAGRQRTPRRIKLDYTSDAEITELATTCAPRVQVAPLRSLPSPDDELEGVA